MAGLSFNVKSNSDELKKTFEYLDKIEAKIKNFNAMISEVAPGSKQFNELSKQIVSLQKQYDDLSKKNAQLQSIVTSLNEVQSAINQTTKATQSIIGATDTFEHFSGSIKELNERLKALRNEYSLLSVEARNSAKGQSIANEIAQLAAQSKISADSLRALQKEYVNINKMQNLQEGSLTSLRAQLSQLTAQYDNLGRSMRNGLAGKELLENIRLVSTEISQAEQASLRFQRNVGNYASSYNGLNTQVQMIMREMPNMAQSFQIFAMSLGNNIPMVVDEIKRAKDEYKSLIAEGKKGVPVWKQVASSIFGWQTALVMGVTLVIAYSKEIGEWLKGLFHSEEALSKNKVALTNFNEAMSKGKGDAQAQLVNLRLLYKAATDAAKGTNTRKKAIDELRSAFPSYFKNISDEAILAGKAASQYNELANAILRSAMARAAEDKIIENSKKILELQDKKAEAEKNQRQAQQEQKRLANGSVYNTPGGAFVPTPIVGAKEQGSAASSVKQYGEAARKASQEIEALTMANKKLADSIDVSDLLFGKDKKAKTKTPVKKVSGNNEFAKLDESILEAQTRTEDARIAAMEEGFSKEKAIIDNNYNKQLLEAKRHSKDLLDQYNKAHKTKLTSLPKDLQEQFNLEVVMLGKSKDSKVDELLKNTLSKYQGYFEKRQSIIDKYAKDYNELQQAGASNESLEENKYQEEQALKELDETVAARSKDYQSWAQEITQISLKNLRKLLSEAERNLREMEKENPNDSNLASARAKVNKLKDINIKTDPNKDSVKKWQELQRTLQDTSKEFKEIGDEIGGTAGKLISSAGDIASSTISMIDGIKTLTTGASDAMEGTAEAAATSMSTVEKASIILAIVSAALQIATKIATMFTGTHKTQADTERLQSVTDRIKATNEAINNLIEKRSELIKNATSAEREYLSTSTKQAIEAQIAYIEQQFKSVQGNWIMAKEGKDNNLTLSDLGITSIEGLEEFLNDAEKIRALQNNGYGFRDRDTFKQIVDDYNAMIDASKELAENTKEAATNLSFDDAKDALDEFIQDADTKFSDVTDNFQKYMRNAILKNVKDSYLTTALQKWYDKFADYTQGGLTQTETNDLQSQYQDIFNQAQDRYNQMLAAAGISSESSTSQNATSKGYNTMSQETGDELSGRFTALQESNQGILNESLKQSVLLSSMLEIMKGSPVSSTPSINVAQSMANDKSSNAVVQSVDTTALNTTLLEVNNALNNIQKLQADNAMLNLDIVDYTKVISTKVKDNLGYLRDIRSNTL